MGNAVGFDPEHDPDDPPFDTELSRSLNASMVLYGAMEKGQVGDEGAIRDFFILSARDGAIVFIKQGTPYADIEARICEKPDETIYGMSTHDTEEDAKSEFHGIIHTGNEHDRPQTYESVVVSRTTNAAEIIRDFVTQAVEGRTKNGNTTVGLAFHAPAFPLGTTDVFPAGTPIATIHRILLEFNERFPQTNWHLMDAIEM